MFPLVFFLVAIPWPTLIEIPIIQTLTQANSSVVIEVLGITGIPAVQHGNLIEVATGTVGIDEALAAEMRAVRELVSLGLQVRTAGKLKVRQPLSRADIVVSGEALA